MAPVLKEFTDEVSKQAMKITCDRLKKVAGAVGTQWRGTLTQLGDSDPAWGLRGGILELHVLR